MTIIPEFHFDSGYEATVEMSEEANNEWKKMMEEHDADAMRFYDVFENDVICCMEDECQKCHLNGVGSCMEKLEANVRKMIDNQRRMYAKFMEMRNDDQP